MTINVDFVESSYRNVPSMTVPAIARALWDAEPMFNTGTDPRMQQFERELKDILPPRDGN